MVAHGVIETNHRHADSWISGSEIPQDAGIVQLCT